jgi:VanZ family protein
MLWSSTFLAPDRLRELPSAQLSAPHRGSNWRTMSRRTRKLDTPRLLVNFWLPVLVYVGIIFSLSAQANLRPPVPFTMSDKVLHLLEYGALGFLLARALTATLRALSPLGIALVALSIGIAIGTADECFQATVPGRDSSALDLAADTAGLAIAQLVYRLLTRG